MGIGNVLVPRPSRLDIISHILRNVQKGADMKLNELGSVELDLYVKFLVETRLLEERLSAR